MHDTKTSIPRTPLLDGEPWHITGYPELGELAYGPEHEVVDHAIWRSAGGSWHAWACVRGTRIGRLIYGWTGDSLTQERWQPQGVVLRADRAAGESINDYNGEEWIQAPHVIEHAGRYFMFYGGHNTELGACQICLATSAGGTTFERYRNDAGQSRLFVGPGEARDPMVLRAGKYTVCIGEQWVCYYCGHDTGSRRPCKVYARTSSDLYHWSDPREVSWGGHASGTGFWTAECPFVVYRDGYYYLFRTSEYRSPARTHVYRSEDPFDFGLGSDAKLVATLRVAAPEIVQDGAESYISSVEDLRGGIQLFRLKWV